MRTIQIITGFLIFTLPLFSQHNQIITDVPSLEITEVRLEDENGNRIIEANETCDLYLTLKNSGGMAASNVRIRLNLVAPEDLDIKYRKSRNIPTLKPGKDEELGFSIAAGEAVQAGLAEFKIEISEQNGFDAFPSNLEIETAQGALVKKLPFMEESESQEETVDQTSFGLVDLHIEDYNENGMLDAYETSELKLRIFNYTDQRLSGSVLYIDPIQGSTTGIDYPRRHSLPPFEPLLYQDISLPIRGKKNLPDGTVKFVVYLVDDSGAETTHQTIDLPTQAYTEPVLRIAQAEFTGSSDTLLRLDEEINLRLLLENAGTGTAFDIEVSPRVTDANVKIEPSKLGFRIEEIPGGKSREINIQMVADRKYMFPNIPVMLEISENFNNLYLDTMVVASLLIPEEQAGMAPEIITAQEEGMPDTPQEEARPEPVVPPNLVLLNHEFIDDDKNQRIDHRESCEIRFTINNNGDGPARDIMVIIDQLNKNIEGLSFQDSILLGDLNPHQEVPVIIPVRSTGINRTDRAEFSIQVIESNGWDAEPLSLLVETQKLLEPDLVLSQATFSGESGPLRKNEDIALHVTVENRGPGEARDVKVQFGLPDNPYIFLMGDAIDLFDIKRLRSGESRELNITFTTSRRYTEGMIPISLEITESYRQFGIDTLLTGIIQEEEMATNTLVIQPVVQEPQTIITPEVQTRQEPETVQVVQEESEQPVETLQEESDQPEDPEPVMRGGGDPLKGLGYEEAITGLEVGRYFALVIGIDEYSGEWPPLQNAQRDAEAMQDLLESKYNFRVRALYNDLATRENIVDEFDWLIRNVKADDNVLIYYSGHGAFREDMNVGFWVPYGVTRKDIFDYIQNTTIQYLINAIGSKHTLLISDACFSGDIFGTSRGESVSVSLDKSPRYYREVYQKASRKALTSGGLERVADSGMEGHSIFTYYLLQGLENNDERLLDASQLFNNLKVPVYNNSRQSPQYEAIRNTGDLGGHFVFIQK